MAATDAPDFIQATQCCRAFNHPNLNEWPKVGGASAATVAAGSSPLKRLPRFVAWICIGT